MSVPWSSKDPFSPTSGNTHQAQQFRSISISDGSVPNRQIQLCLQRPMSGDGSKRPHVAIPSFYFRIFPSASGSLGMGMGSHCATHFTGAFSSPFSHSPLTLSLSSHSLLLFSRCHPDTGWQISLSLSNQELGDSQSRLSSEPWGGLLCSLLLLRRFGVLYVRNEVRVR